MRLIPDALEEPQGIGTLLEHDRLGSPRDEDLLDPLGEADHRHPRSISGSSAFSPGGELSLPPVDHDQVGERGEARVAVESCGEMSACWT